MESINDFESFENYINELGEEYELIDKDIPIKVQMEYFKTAQKAFEKFDSFEENEFNIKLDEWIEELYNKEAPLDKKKELLVILASLEEVNAYNAIKEFEKTAEGEVKHWAKLALQQSKLTLENSFLDKKKVLIASGLGGKGDKLRYFIVLIKRSPETFTETEKMVVKNELSIALHENNGELEKIYFDDYFVSALVLYDIKKNIIDLLNETIVAINEYGDFIREQFLVTNVKVIPKEEIKETVAKIFKS